MITIRFLKSTDDDMLKTLETMSGTTHVSAPTSKTVTVDKGKITNLTRNEETLSYNVATEERPVISFNDMAFIPDRNSMVFRAGDSPIWNRQEMILPMSWRLFQNTIVNPGHDYSLQTVPTLSTAMDFDVRKNQPDFNHWFNKRLSQMTYVTEAVEIYKDVHGYTDRDLELLDPDIYADDIMRIINNIMHPELFVEDDADPEELEMLRQGDELIHEMEEMYVRNMEANKEVMDAAAQAEKEDVYYTEKIFAHKTISREALVGRNGKGRGFDDAIVDLFKDEWQAFYDDKHFTMDADRNAGPTSRATLKDARTGVEYFVFSKVDQQDGEQLASASKDEKSRVYAENPGDATDYVSRPTITQAFYDFLVNLSPNEFDNLVNGKLADMLKKEVGQ